MGTRALLWSSLVVVGCAGAGAPARPSGTSSGTPSTSPAASPPAASANANEEPAPLADPKWGAGVRYEPSKQSTLAKPPGPCVDPGKDVARRMKLPFAVATPIDPPPPVDFDGDGVADVIFSAGAVDISEHVFLYVMRGSCGHFVGYFFNHHKPSEATRESANGLLVLQGRRASRTGAARREATLYRFDGTAYREAESPRP